jgi:hypothetical protein
MAVAGATGPDGIHGRHSMRIHVEGRAAELGITALDVLTRAVQGKRTSLAAERLAYFAGEAARLTGLFRDLLSYWMGVGTRTASRSAGAA